MHSGYEEGAVPGDGRAGGRRGLIPRPGLLAVLLGLLGLPAPPAGADRVRILATDRQAAEARVEVVVEAREEILASAFIFGNDPFTLTSLGLLRDAVRRGVRVQVIVDAQWNKIPRPVQAHLAAEGIEIREYHPFRLHKLRWVTRRMHDKMIVADGGTLLAGGRNIESPYFGFGRQLGRRNYIDCDLLVEGDAAGLARDYFRKLWVSREVRETAAQATPGELAEASRLLDEHRVWLNQRIEEARNDPNRLPAVLLEVGPVRFLHDPVGRKGEEPGVADGLFALMESARGSVFIESPYLVPSRAFTRSLRAALGRGVRVRILTNSLAVTDNLLAQAGYVGHKKDLVRRGVELWEYTGPECLHSKVVMIDGETVVVGSFNLDPRSEHLNTELALVATDPELAAELQRILDENLERSVRIDERGFPAGADERYPGIPAWKLFKLRLYRLVAPFIKRQI